MYENTVTRIRPGGGSVKVTLSGGVAQANSGTSLLCAGCFVQAAIANTEVVKMNIGVAASANLGVELARQYVSGTTAGGAAQPLFVPISDLNNLYFYSADDNAIVDITYFKGA